MPKKRSTPNAAAKKSSPTKTLAKRLASVGPGRNEYVSVLTDLTQLIRDSRRRALATVNRELVCLYWHIGRTIVEQQETAHWGDAVVEQLATDLRAAFPDMKGLMKENLFRTRKFFLASREIDAWLMALNRSENSIVATASPQISASESRSQKVATVSPQLDRGEGEAEKVATLSRLFQVDELATLIPSVSWSHHKEIIGACDRPNERYFYMAMSVRERWSVRELRRQIDAALFERYVSVKRDPEKCLPTDAEHGDLLPFKDHYVLEFLGLEDEHTEKELRKAILGNLRDFFLEFGKDLTFVGEEYPLTVGADTFYIDLLFFHRRLQCLISVDFHPMRYPNHVTIPLRLCSPKPKRRQQLCGLHQRSSPETCRTSRGRSPFDHKSSSTRTDLLRSLPISSRRHATRKVPEDCMGKAISQESPRRSSHGVKIGKFKPEYAGKSQFYCAALDEQLRLPHENPSIGLVLCKTADHAQVRLALTAAARRIGIATYQTVLPDEHVLEQRLAHLPMPQESEP